MTRQRSDLWAIFCGGILGVLVSCALVVTHYRPEIKPRKVFRNIGIGVNGSEVGVPSSPKDDNPPVPILTRE